MITRLASNLNAVRENIKRVCSFSGRDAALIQLIVVTKMIPASTIKQLYELGVEDIGESRIQGAQEKILELSLPLTWHMIGHLQTNKAQKAVRLFKTIQSVDSIHLAEAIDREAKEQGEIMDIFLQVNASGERTKSGFSPNMLDQSVSQVEKLKHVHIQGLMTMAPLTSDETDIRKTFRALHETRQRINSHWKLSMGMSQDYPIALEEGADILRIGTAIFEGV